MIDSLRTINNYIDGAAVPSGATAFTDLVDPRTGQVTGRSPKSTPSEVDEACRAAAVAFESWARTTPSTRQRALLELADALELQVDQLVELQIRNTGQPRWLIAQNEIVMGADQLRFFAGAARIMEGKAGGEYVEGFTSYVRREPIGVVAQITPWNYPLLMAIWKIAPALAAGNTIVLKPSDTTPESTVRLAEIAGDILPAGVLNVVNGDATTGATLVEHPIPGLVAITGSVAAGIAVATTAARQLKRVHLELGGKAPALVFADADIDKAAQGIVDSGFFNAGQDCTAACRVLVQDTIHDEFLAALVHKAEGYRPSALGTTIYGPLNNSNHFNRVMSYLRELPAHAIIETGGHQVDTDGFYVAPTIISGVKQDDALVREEIFGPVISVQHFSDEDEAVTMANGVPYGLASSVWSSNHSRVQRLSRDLNFGCVWVNTHTALAAEMPHGGFGASGYGKDLSTYGLEDYTRIKHVMSAMT